MAEALNGSFKADLIGHRGPWRGADQVEHAVVHSMGRLVQHQATALRPRLRPTRRIRGPALPITSDNECRPEQCSRPVDRPRVGAKGVPSRMIC